MSLENFFGFDTGEGMDESAFEAFKEKMKAAAAQIAAIKKEESKQKKKEEELLKILLKFVKSSQKHELVSLISRALEQNIPAHFILAIILLSNRELMGETGSKFFLSGPAAEERAIVFFQEDETLPLKIRIELDNWLKYLLLQAEDSPQKLLKTAYDTQFIELPDPEEDAEGNVRKKYREEKELKVILVQLSAYIMREFLESQKISEPYQKLADFCRFMLVGILDKTKEGLENRKLLD